MTDDQIAQLIIDGVGYLKLTTLGYSTRPVSYWQNTATNWYKGLSKLYQAVTELKRRHSINISLTGTVKVGSTITATITAT